MAFVEFEKVSKIYHTGAVEIPALRDATFQVEKGEICVIVGASGAGKTTLLNILCIAIMFRLIISVRLLVAVNMACRLLPR